MLAHAQSGGHLLRFEYAAFKVSFALRSTKRIARRDEKGTGGRKGGRKGDVTIFGRVIPVGTLNGSVASDVITPYVRPWARARRPGPRAPVAWGSPAGPPRSARGPGWTLPARWRHPGPIH